jgi:hypothetical protein
MPLSTDDGVTDAETPRVVRERDEVSPARRRRESSDEAPVLRENVL